MRPVHDVCRVLVLVLGERLEVRAGRCEKAGEDGTSSLKPSRLYIPLWRQISALDVPAPAHNARIDWESGRAKATGLWCSIVRTELR